MSDFGIYAGQIVAASQPEGVPSVPDATLFYTVDAWIDGAKFRFSNVRPPVSARPDPLAANPLLVFPFVPGEWVKLVGSVQNGNFVGVIDRIVGEVEAYGPCGGA